AEPFCHRKSLRQSVDGEDLGRAGELGSHRRTQADRALGKHRDRVADSDASSLGAAEPRAHDIGAHEHLLVGESVGDGGEVRHRIGHQNVLGLTSVDRVAKPPAPDRLSATLGRIATKARVALAARRDRSGDDALAEAVTGYCRAKLLDDADGLMAYG